MNADAKPITGYLLIKTRYIPDGEAMGNDQADALIYNQIKKDAQRIINNLEAILEKEPTSTDVERTVEFLEYLGRFSKYVNEKIGVRPVIEPSLIDEAHEKITFMIKEIMDEYKIEGPIRGAIVDSDEEELAIIVSFRAKDQTLFDTITNEIIGLSVPTKSDVEVSEVTEAISKEGTKTGFVGPP
jgi:hypothetical protein